MRIFYTRRSLQALERIGEFLDDPVTVEHVLELIMGAIEMLRWHPHVGRLVRGGFRELVISYGKTGYVALYRVVGREVQILTVRHQREVGYR